MSLAPQPCLDEIWKLFQESDRKWQEMAVILHEVAQSQKITALKLENELRESSQAFDKQMKEVNVIIGQLGSKLGDFIEEMVRPAIVRLFREQSIPIYEVHSNVTSQRNNEGIEVDLLVVNDTDIIAIECEITLNIDDVNEHLERLEKLKRLLPAHANKQVMGAVTAMSIPENVARYAYRQGLYVIRQTGNQLVVCNDLQFQAKIW